MKRVITCMLAVSMLFFICSAASAAGSPPDPVKDLRVAPLGGQMKLDWCKTQGVEGTLNYEVYRKVQDKLLVDADIVQANKVGTFGSDGGCLSFIDSAVESGNSYSYAVIVVDGSGNRSAISQGQEAAGTVAVMP